MDRMTVGARIIAVLAFVTACLYFGAELLMPLSVAVLVAFLLAPVVSAMERIGLGRVPSVIATPKRPVAPATCMMSVRRYG